MTSTKRTPRKQAKIDHLFLLFCKAWRNAGERKNFPKFHDWAREYEQTQNDLRREGALHDQVRTTQA